MKKFSLFLVAAFVAGGFIILSQDKVNALAMPLGSVKAFTVTCTPTPTKITGGESYKAVRCMNRSVTIPAYIGGSSVSVAQGYELGGPSGVDNALTVETVTPLYCVTDPAVLTLLIKCIGGQ